MLTKPTAHDHLAERVRRLFGTASCRLQVAALPWRMNEGNVEILLITSRDTGRWVIPKGWPMQGRRSHAVAEREAFEEAGVKGKVQKDPIGHYLYQKGMAEGLKVPCKVQVYALEVDDLCKNFPEKGERNLEWVSCQEAAARVQEPGLKELFLEFERKMRPVPPAPEQMIQR